MRRLIVSLALSAIALLAACGGEEPKTMELPPMTPAEVADHRASLAQLQQQLESVAATMGEVETLAARVQSLGIQVEAMRQHLEAHRIHFEEAALDAQERWETGRGRTSGGVHGLFLFLLGVVLTAAAIAAHRVFFVQDTGEFPPEAHVPGVTTPPAAPPTDTESP